MDARVFLYDKTGEAWRLKKEMQAVLGEKGMAWGIGLHPEVREKPQKAEGDRRSPAGVFSLGAAYGYDPAPPRGSRWPYRPSVAKLLCVDDPVSRHYNEIVTDSSDRDWRSAEPMVRTDDLYRRVIVVRHNDAPAVPSGGSCIFIHVWKDGKTGTSGCTALALNDVEYILKWIDPGAKPVLVQLPEPVYREVQAAWELPPVVTKPEI